MSGVKTVAPMSQMYSIVFAHQRDWQHTAPSDIVKASCQPIVGNMSGQLEGSKRFIGCGQILFEDVVIGVAQPGSNYLDRDFAGPRRV